jgi:hypothetical protein
MLFRIATQWGCPVRHVEEQLSCSELQEWIAYYDIEPFGDHWRTFANAYASAGVASCAGHKNQKVAAFMPDMEPKEQTVEEMQAVIGQVAKSAGFKVING